MAKQNICLLLCRLKYKSSVFPIKLIKFQNMKPYCLHQPPSKPQLTRQTTQTSLHSPPTLPNPSSIHHPLPVPTQPTHSPNTLHPIQTNCNLPTANKTQLVCSKDIRKDGFPNCNMINQLPNAFRCLDADKKTVEKEKVRAILVNVVATQEEGKGVAEGEKRKDKGTMQFNILDRDVGMLVEGFRGDSKDLMVKFLIKEMASLEPNSIVFHWNSENTKNLPQLLPYIILKKYTAIFSRGSYKALAKYWEQKQLGPNPFTILSNQFTTLKTQYQNSKQYELQVRNCDQKTISYLIEQCQIKHNKYRLQILSAIENNKQIPGHILITYPNYGKILININNWKEFVGYIEIGSKTGQISRTVR